MYVSPETLELLAKLGVNGLDAVAVIRAFETDMVAQTPPPSPADERRRERNRRHYEAKRLKSSDSDAIKTPDKTADASEWVSPAPLPPRPPNPTPPSVSISTGAKASRRLSDFEIWYDGYPHKVARGAAEKAFATALGLAPLDDLLAGRDRYIRDKPPDRSWCNPATWLNQKRWLDEPQPSGGAAHVQRSHPNGPAERSAERARRIFAGAQVAVGAGGHGLSD